MSMHNAAYGLAATLAAAIILIGTLYIFTPWAATASFGLVRPAEDRATLWWLRLKGVRDIVSGLVVFALMAWGSAPMVGIVLLVEALIPLGDMTVILAARGSVQRAFGIHGLTVLLMLVAGIPLASGAA
jgi:hypothetical protein